MKNTIRDKQNFIHKLLPLAVLPLILAACLGLWISLIPDNFSRAESDNSVWDLRGAELSNSFVYIAGPAEHIPGALLTPDEFNDREGEAIIGFTQNEQYLTSRLRIILPDDGWYTFSRMSIDFSERVFVNGELLLDVGKPGDSRESAVPDTARITFTVRPENGIVEIVQQSSNFVHREGGYHADWRIGTQNLIEYNRNTDFIASIILGCFLSLFLIFILLFFFLHGYKANLYFALFCLMWFLRSGVTGTKIFSAVFPWLSWYAKFRIEYIALPVAAILTVAMINTLFPGVTHKVFRRLVYIVSAGFAALFLLADTVIMSRAILPLYALYGLGILYITVRFVMKLRNLKQEQWIFTTGATLFLFSAIWDFLYYNSIIQILLPIPASYMSHMAMLVFAFFEATAVFIATMREVERAKAAEQNLAVEVAALDRVNQLKTDLMRTISHETLTPLAVMMGFAEITARDAKNSGMSDEIVTNLNTIADEAGRLAAMMEEMRRIALARDNAKDRRPVDIAEVIKKIAGLYAKVIERRGTTLAIEIAEALPPVYGSENELVQIVFNLLRNSDKHTENGTVTIRAEYENGRIKVTVSDTGTGIVPELLPNVFERGVHGDEDGTGYGLAVCRDIITAYGGEIWIESDGASGTDAIFTLPPYGAESGARRRAER